MDEKHEYNTYSESIRRQRKNHILVFHHSLTRAICL